MAEESRHSISERLAELYRRLRLLPASNSSEAALLQLCETLDQVEDELSGISKQPPPVSLGMSDGRMYCPLEDHISRRGDGSILALTRGHRIEIGSDGGLKIVNKVTLKVEFEK